MNCASFHRESWDRIYREIRQPKQDTLLKNSWHYTNIKSIFDFLLESKQVLYLTMSSLLIFWFCSKHIIFGADWKTNFHVQDLCLGRFFFLQKSILACIFLNIGFCFPLKYHQSCSAGFCFRIFWKKVLLYLYMKTSFFI